MNAATRTYAIIGWPVHHSRSPRMQNAAFQATGVNAAYVAFAVPPAQLGHAVKGIAALGIAGANITVPHKTEVLSLLDFVHEDAKAIGAVNTVVQRDGVLHGYNTDAPGFIRSLESASVTLQGSAAVVLGAGGSARAVIVGLIRAGVQSVTVAARRPEQAEELVLSLSAHAQGTHLSTSTWTAEDLERVFLHTDLLVQTTSATLDDAAAGDELADFLPMNILPKTAVVTDIVYSPRMTAVLRKAQQHQLAIVDGLGMLLHQGALAFELWTGQPAPIDAMREALEQT